jgi:hypothetical protein
MTAVAFPKPESRPKKPRKAIQRKARIQAKRWGVSHGPSKTKHARRPRNFGRMAFVKTLPCGLADAFFVVAGSLTDGPPPGLCSGPIECMHLGDRAGWRRCSDDETAPGCRTHHRGIDGTVGGRAPWYVALGRDGQRALRAELVSRASEAWGALGEAGQKHWRELAAARRTR